MEDGVTEEESLFHPKQEEKEEDQKEKTEEAHSKGLLNQIVSNLVCKVEPESESETEKKEDPEKGNGILENIISLVSPKAPATQDGTVKDAANDNPKTEEEEGGKGGLIDNIRSHFPTSLPEDAAPTTDEASILIHSIVHD